MIYILDILIKILFLDFKNIRSLKFYRLKKRLIKKVKTNPQKQ